MPANAGIGGTQGQTPFASFPIPTVDQRLAFVSVGLDCCIDSHTASDRRPDTEPSPSTGAKETAGAMHAVYGLGDPDPVATTESDEYLKDFFEVSS